jgi:uracil-DNA glycosylase family 4
VKHFRFVYKDSFRQHQSPSRYHVQACKPWLTAEIAAIKPALIVCLGNTAARSLIHPNFVMKQGRGALINETPPRMATYHPSAILRLSGQEQNRTRDALVDDLRKAKEYASLITIDI